MSSFLFSDLVERLYQSATTTTTAIQQRGLTSTLMLIAAAYFISFIVRNVLNARKNSSKNLEEKSKHQIDLQQQSIPYMNDPVERMSLLIKDDKRLVTHQFNDVRTLNDVFERGNKLSNKLKCIGQVNSNTNNVEWFTYGEVFERTKHFADGLLKLGLQPYNKSSLGIYSANCPEYVIVEYGSYRHSIIIVPVYDTLGTNVASFIANQAELICIVCDQTDRIDRIIKQADDFTTLKHIILMKNANAIEKLREKVANKGFQLHTLAEVELLGKENPQSDHKPSVNDLAIICYTSGTTSVPKGVMLTHENVIASVATISIHLMEHHATMDDTMISILPLAHMFQRIGEASVFCEGGKVAYYSGDIQRLAQEIKIIKPTIMLAVPRLLNRIYEAIYNKIRGNLFKKIMLRLAYHAKRRDLQRNNEPFVAGQWDWFTIDLMRSILEPLVFGKIRENLGGQIRLICVGSAPLNHSVLEFLRSALGCVISEGYGQTECVGPCTATLMPDQTTGHIGPPLVGSLVKLADFSEMNYYSVDGKGEILVKGAVVCKGYYKMPEKTKEVIDVDGWLHTGDIGEWTEQGTLRLIDRKKNIFKLSQGEYIAPEKIENILINSRYVTQIFVYGESLKSVLVGIVVPNFEFIQNSTNPKLKSIDIKRHDLTPLREIILEDLLRVGKRAGLKSFELLKNVHLHPEPFTIEQGLLTPTLKSKRKEIEKHFRSQIDLLYNEIEPTEK